MTRFYVTMTWDDWPEGGSYGTVVEAESYEDAERLTKEEMAKTRAEGHDEDDLKDPEWWLENEGNNWHVVDCFELDPFIQKHSAQGATA